jgi:hypothetical protein
MWANLGIFFSPGILMPGEKNKQPILLKFECINCDYITYNKKDYNRHILTQKHLKGVNGELKENFSIQEISPKYHCPQCNYTTNKHSNFITHESTKKHTARLNNQQQNNNQCDICNKIYSKSSNLWKHKKICKVLENKNELTNQFREHDNRRPEITVELVLDLIKQNKELQTFLMTQHTASMEQNNKLIDIVKSNVGGNQSITNTNSNNTTNNQFNLQFFLNETCKDAMNITDFINSLQLTTEDFENTGKVGFIEGITQIIINRMSSVDTTKRPMHCTDAKRETVYIKDDNVWEKEDDKKTKLRKVVNQVANKNLQQIVKWQEEHPDCINLDTPDNINFRKYYKAAIGGASNEEDEKIFEKIKRNVLKEIVVNK